MNSSPPALETASGRRIEQLSPWAIGVASGAAAPVLAFTMSRAIAVRSVLPFLISVVMVIGGLTIGFIYGVDAVAALVDAFGLLMSEGVVASRQVALIILWGLR